MPQKVFMYSPDAANKDAINYFKGKGYTPVALTDDEQVFWDGLASVNQGGSLALMSHGDGDGPLLIAGTDGADLTVAQTLVLTNALVQHGITFYCLSCRTGGGTFATALTTANVPQWVAPLGNAAVAASHVSVAIHSTDDKGKAVAWAGPLSPGRIGKVLNVQ